MRYCVFGDVHSNLEALTAVLADAREQQVERYVCVGDIVGCGADPHECLARVRAVTSEIVLGNHDAAAVGRTSIEDAELEEGRDSADAEGLALFAREAILWTAEQLSADEKAFVWGLPLSLVADGMTVVHATVHEPEHFGYIENALVARLSFEALQTEIGFVGHSHVPVTFFYEAKGDEIWYSQDAEVPLGDFSKAIVNVGSVGQPRDDNPQACYAVFDSERRTVTVRRVPYDVEAARQKILAAGLPEILATRLLLGR